MKLTPRYKATIVIYDEPDDYMKRFAVYLNRQQQNEAIAKSFLELNTCTGCSVYVSTPSPDSFVTVHMAVPPIYVGIVESIKEELLNHFGENQINVVTVKR